MTYFSVLYSVNKPEGREEKELQQEAVRETGRRHSQDKCPVTLVHYGTERRDR